MKRNVALNDVAENTKSRRGKIDWLGKLIVIAALLGYALFSTWLRIPCPILKLTGIRCLGCGMTRAVMALLQGEWQQALQHHGMVWSLPVLVLLFLFDGKLFRRRGLNILIVCLLAIGFLVNWILN